MLDIAGQFRDRIAHAPMEDAPFHHIVLDDVFPASLYASLLRARPAPEAFGGNQFGHIRLSADHDPLFGQLPADVESTWLDLNSAWTSVIGPALSARFAPLLNVKLRNSLSVTLPDTDLPAASAYEVSPLIMQRRKPGNVQAPHMDNAASLFTAIFYLADDSASSGDGLTLYSISRTEELTQAYLTKREIRSWHPSPEEFGFEPARFVEYRPNRMIAFLSSAHSIHSVSVNKTENRYSIQGQCPMPKQLGDVLFSGWHDVLAHTGRDIYA